MQKFFSLVLVFYAFHCNSQKNSSDIKNWKYDLEGVKTAIDGTYLVKVWVFSKNPEVDFDLAKKMAVHGVIFKGYSGSKGLSGQPPLTDNPNLLEEKQDFFEDFFSKQGKYSNFINLSSDEVGPGDRIKVDKDYKIGIVMSIRKDDLRKFLESAGLIKSLSNGF